MASTLRQCHLFVTIFYLFLTINLCRLLRLANNNLVPLKLRPLLGDVISTFQTIACGFETTFVRYVYGDIAYCLGTFYVSLWSSWTYGKDTSGNPVTTFKHFFTRKFGFSRTLIHSSAQMLGGLLAYQYASGFWRIGLSSQHTRKLAAYPQCVTDLNVPVFLGFFIELSATIIDTVVSRTTTKRFMFERYEQFVKGVFSVWLTMMGINLTGLYINPSNATAKTFGCSGISTPEFIFVYWLGPILGAAIGLALYQNLWAVLQLIPSRYRSVVGQSAPTNSGYRSNNNFAASCQFKTDQSTSANPGFHGNDDSSASCQFKADQSVTTDTSCHSNNNISAASSNTFSSKTVINEEDKKIK